MGILSLGKMQGMVYCDTPDTNPCKQNMPNLHHKNCALYDEGLNHGADLDQLQWPMFPQLHLDNVKARTADLGGDIQSQVQWWFGPAVFGHSTEVQGEVLTPCGVELSYFVGKGILLCGIFLLGRLDWNGSHASFI